MKISIEVLEKIANDCGTFEIGNGDREFLHNKETMTLRFGYWRKVNFEILKNILNDKQYSVEENLVDEDDDCGELYNYIITPRGVA